MQIYNLKKYESMTTKRRLSIGWSMQSRQGKISGMFYNWNAKLKEKLPVKFQHYVSQFDLLTKCSAVQNMFF